VSSPPITSSTPSVSPPRTRRPLTQRPAATALAVGLLAIPGIPLTADALLPQREWATVDASQEIRIFTADGNGITVFAPDGWQGQDRGDSAVLKSGSSLVLVRIYDREARDPRTVAERVMRADRVAGISSAWDGGQVASADGTLTGQTCATVTERSVGSCAFVFDDDVVVSVLSLGDTQTPALPIGDVVAAVTTDVR
jgi:hypothetical protein